MKSQRSCAFQRSVTSIVLRIVAFVNANPGPRKVFRPRLSAGSGNAWVVASGRPLLPRKVDTMPVPLIGVVKVRQLPVTGSRVIWPDGLYDGRCGPVVPVPAVSTPVRIVNGWPD